MSAPKQAVCNLCARRPGWPAAALVSQWVGGRTVFLASVKLSVLAADLALAAPATRWARADAEADAIRHKGTGRGPDAWLNSTSIRSRREPGLIAAGSGECQLRAR